MADARIRGNMPKTVDRNTKLAYAILDYVAGCGERDVDLTTKRTVNAVAKIIEEFDGRETVELEYIHPHAGYLRGIRRT